MRQSTVTLPYRTPGERARLATRRMAENSALSLAIVVCVALLAFLTTGDFSATAWAALGIGVAKSGLDLAITFLRHLLAARAEATTEDAAGT